VICLLCGKKYKDLGKHLRVHDVTPDEYRERYRIPWTYALCTLEVSDNYSDAVRVRMDAGFVPPSKYGSEHMKMVGAVRRKRPMESPENLGEYSKPSYPLVEGPHGELLTQTAAKDANRAKRGTPEFHAKMLARPQSEARKAALSKYWKGRKQTREHLTKRMKRIHGEGWEPKPEKT
jgi:hypothetical protein